MDSIVRSNERNQSAYIENSTLNNDPQSSRFVRKHRSNVESDLIEITEDKLENILLKYVKKLNIKDSWISPASILITVVIAKTTAKFSPALGLSAEVWEAIFIVTGFLSAIWLVKNLIKIFNNRNETSISSLMTKIKNSQEATES